MFFFIGTTVIIGLLIVYFSTEGWSVLHAPQREFIFWVAIITAETGLAVLSRDSPIRSIMGDTSTRASPLQLLAFFGLAVPLVSAYVLSWKFMKELLPYNPTRSLRESHFFAFKTPISAKAKQNEVNSTLDSLSYRSHIRYFIAHLRGKLTERQEKLKQILQKATPEELNFIFRNSNMPMLLQYGNLLESLITGDTKLDKLDPLPKAVFMHGLMKIGTLPYNRTQREWVTKMFKSTLGDELTVLKMHLDGSTDFHNLFKLVFSDFATDKALQDEILLHFQTEGVKILKLNTEKNFPLTVKVLSDVDDTLWCSAGKWPAGVDRSLPSHQVYPGVLALYEEIDSKGFLSPNNNNNGGGEGDEDDDKEQVKVTVELPYERGGGTASLRVSSKDTVQQIQHRFMEQFKVKPSAQRLVITASRENRHGTNSRGYNLAFLSARPHAFKDFAESSSYAKFKKLFEEGRMHTHPTLLAGSLKSGANAMWGDISRKMRSHMLQAVQLCSALFIALDDKMLHTKGPLRAKAERWASEDVNQSLIMAEGGLNANWQSVGKFKAETFMKFHLLYPECTFLFIGDDGQGDVLASELMAKHLSSSSRNPIALIHRVLLDSRDVLTSLPANEDRDKAWKDMGILFFDTYVGASVQLLELGMITAKVVHRVGVTSVDELIEMMLSFPTFPGWTRAMEMLNADILKANEAIRKASAGNPKSPQIEYVKSPF